MRTINVKRSKCNTSDFTIAVATGRSINLKMQIVAKSPLNFGLSTVVHLHRLYDTILIYMRVLAAW